MIRAVLLCAALYCAGSLAQTYPTKPIHMVITFPPGASSDVVGRMLGQKISEFIGVQLVADNRAGAGGNLGTAVVANVPPDGYTIVIATGSVAISPALYANPGYDALRDLTPVARLTTMSLIMLVHPSVPAKTLRQFIELARARTGKLNFGSGGAGTTNHLANELLNHIEKINLVHVPYKGVTQAMAAMIGGEVDEVVMPVTTAISQVRAAKCARWRCWRKSASVHCPKCRPQQKPGSTASPCRWYAMFAPAGTPRDIVSRLNRETLKALEAPDIRERLATLDVEPWPSTPEQLGDFLRAEIARYETIARSARLPKQ